MKILILTLLYIVSALGLYSQSTLPLRADTILIEKVGGNAFLKLKDSSRNTTGGILTNIGGGVYVGKKPKKLNDSTLLIGKDTIIIGGTTPSTPSWQQTLNVSNTTTSTLIHDTTMIGTQVEKEWAKYEPLIKTDTATNAFHQWQNSGDNNGSQNEVMFWGWNVGPGGGQYLPNRPAIGESWESNFRNQPSPGVFHRYMEKHEIYVTPDNVQHRLGSYTIDVDAGTINYYKTTDNFTLHNVSTHTPYYSIFGVSNATQATWVNSADQTSSFTLNADFNQDATTSSLSILNGAGKPTSLFKLVDFDGASVPNLSVAGRGYDGAEIGMFGLSTGLLSKIMSDSSQFLINTFADVPIRFQINSSGALSLRSTRVNIFQPTIIGTGLGVPIAQLDVRSPTQDQTLYVENTKAGGYAGILTSTNGTGGNVGLDITATGTLTNKGINFNSAMTANDFNIFSNNTSNAFFGGKIGIRTATPAQALHINGQVQIDTVTNGTLGDSILTIKDGLVQKISGTGIGSNFANTDLRFTGNRTHIAAGYNLTIDSLKDTYIIAKGKWFSSIPQRSTLRFLPNNNTTPLYIDAAMSKTDLSDDSLIATITGSPRQIIIGANDINGLNSALTVSSSGTAGKSFISTKSDSLAIGVQIKTSADTILVTGTYDATTKSNPIYKSSLTDVRGYKIYTVLLSQSGTSDPTAVVLGANNIGTIVWTRDALGAYSGTLSGAFTANKTMIFVGQNADGITANCTRSNNNAVQVKTYITATGGSTDTFNDLSIEIRVYP